MAHSHSQRSPIRPPGLPAPPALASLHRDLKKKRIYKFVLADDGPTSTVSISKSPSKEQEDSSSTSIQAQGEIKTADQQGPLKSPRSLDSHDITKFYGDFLASQKKYIGHVSTKKPNRNCPNKAQVQHGRQAVADSPTSGIFSSHKQNIAQNRQKRQTFAAMCTRGTTHSNKDSPDGSITWEDFQFEKKRQEQEIKLSEAATKARENERLFLGPLSSTSVEENCSTIASGDAILTAEVDLLEFSPTIEPTSTPGTSASEPFTEPEFLNISRHAFGAEANHQTSTLVQNLEPTYSVQISSNPSSPTPVPHHDPPENRFGNMVLQGLGDRRVLTKKTIAKKDSSNERPASPQLHQGKIPQSQSCPDPNDLIEL